MLRFNELGVHLHFVHVTQKWLWLSCSDFINKNEWPPNLLNFNQLNYHV